MARADQPSETLPWVLRQKGLKLLDMTLDDEGHTVLVFKSPMGAIREVTVSLVSDKVVQWVYGYTIHDKGSKTKTTYAGVYGDPTKDDLVSISGG